MIFGGMNMNKYSVWVNQSDSLDRMLIKGTEPNFNAWDTDRILMLYAFEASTWEEAMSIYYLRQGWAPYKPLGDAQPCPICKEYYYPCDSGECWKCN